MRLAVIGLGNVLLGDDGFGPFVIELLRTRYDVPSEVDLLDLGTPGLGLIGYLHGYDHVVVVDAVTIPEAPGEVRVFESDELDRMPVAPRVSPHDPALAEALSVVRAARHRPSDACLVGAVPRSQELGAGLTPEMRAAADAAAEIVRQRVQELGFAMRRRDARGVEDGWWHRPREAPGVAGAPLR